MLTNAQKEILKVIHQQQAVLPFDVLRNLLPAAGANQATLEKLTAYGYLDRIFTTGPGSGGASVSHVSYSLTDQGYAVFGPWYLRVWIHIKNNVPLYLGLFSIFASILTLSITYNLGHAQNEETRLSNSATLAMGFNDRMFTGTNGQISDAVELPTTPILQPKGRFTASQLENYLGDYDSLYYFAEEHLIDDQILYDIFSYDVEMAYRNSEIQTYLKRLRAQQGNSDLYIGFDSLSNLFFQMEKSGEVAKLSL